MFTPGDLEDLHAIFGDPDVVRHMGPGQPLSHAETEVALKSIIAHWEQHGIGRWAVVEREAGKLIGFAGIRFLEGTPEVVYLLAKKCWGRGLATEIASACLEYGFRERLYERIVAVTKPANVASQRVMRKLGMKYEGEARYYGYDVVQYGLSRDEYEKQTTKGK
ncbi:MAG: GNAT family N-acetyltransferase [Acidobacteria bacterium]|nr:GNAT family N-acetyltransferase [Acidobacteriota bacterium]